MNGSDLSDTLITASRNNNMDLVRKLLALPLDRGVDLNAFNGSALALASREGHVHMVQFLIGGAAPCPGE